MILKRKAYGQLLEWKNKYQGKRSLLVEGARRVGKSYLVEEFAKKEYKSYILVNFDDTDAEIRDLFEKQGYDLDYLYASLSAIYRVPLYERDSLIILDEVQLCPKARSLTKKMVADGRYDVIATGSLLSIKENVKDIVIPSEEKKLKLYPLDFEEFLWARGNEVLFPLVRRAYEQKTPLGQAIHQAAMKEFRQYLLVGGMPQSVIAYVENNSFLASDDEKRDILEIYRDDVAKHSGSAAPRVRALFKELPGALSKKEKKFNVSALGDGARSREYDDAVFWLSDAMISNNCYAATEPTVGLNMNLDDSKFKCYMMDTGLLVTHALNSSLKIEEDLYKAVLMDRLGINEGMLTENYVAQALKTSGHELFFFSSPRQPNDRSDEMEIDFLIVQGRRVVPIEVKSGDTVHHVSLTKFTNKYRKHIGTPIILCRRDLEEKDGILYLPLYMASLL